jgi:hypothetical protein
MFEGDIVQLIYDTVRSKWKYIQYKLSRLFVLSRDAIVYSVFVEEFVEMLSLEKAMKPKENKV